MAQAAERDEITESGAESASDTQPILVVDDDDAILKIYELVLADRGFETVSASSSAAALEELRRRNFSLMLVDLRLPGMDGLELLQKAREILPRLQVIVVTGHGSVETAVQAMKMGAYDYLAKPFLPDELLLTIEKALAFTELATQNEMLRSALARQGMRNSLIVGTSAVMQCLYDRVRSVAPVPATVLIRGESGTGKEVVADEIHRLGPRADAPFLKINCAAIPEHLLEDELFGHEKGAYTGATSMRKGKFEFADGGTILLDEIGEMPPLLQVKLLRILQEKRFHRLGSNRDILSDVRILCATNMDLEKAVSEGRFREDLYYRLNVVELRIPALREHLEDIPVLADEMLRRLCLEHAVPRHAIAPATMEILCRYDYPGNIRELKNLLEHALIFSRDQLLQPADLPERLRVQFASVIAAAPAAVPTLPAADPSGEPKTLADMELDCIRKALAENGNNMVQTAKALGISRSTLYAKIKQLRK